MTWLVNVHANLCGQYTPSSAIGLVSVSRETAWGIAENKKVADQQLKQASVQLKERNAAWDLESGMKLQLSLIISKVVQKPFHHPAPYFLPFHKEHRIVDTLFLQPLPDLTMTYDWQWTKAPELT